MLNTVCRNQNTRLVSRLIYECLHKNGVSNVFVYTGGAVMGLINEFHESNNVYGIKTYTGASEGNLVAAAIGYARSSGKPGVVVSTSGPGILNCITNIYDAQTDGIPLVAISGQVPISSFGKNAFQEAPSVEVMKPLTKWSHLLAKTDSKYVSDTINRAFNVARAPRCGAVFLDIPKCVLNARTNTTAKSVRVDKSWTSSNRNSVLTQSGIDELLRLSGIKRPVVIVGKGCSNAATDLWVFAVKNRIPITSTLHGLGIFNESHPLSLKMHGMHGSYAANMAIQKADCILAFGSRFDDRSIGAPLKYAPNAKHIVLVNNDKSAILGIKPSVHIVEDCAATLRYINNIEAPFVSYDEKAAAEWCDTINAWKNTHPYGPIDGAESTNFGAASVISELNKYMAPLDLCVVAGVGNHQMIAARCLTHTRPHRFYTSGSLGVMGTAVSMATGIKIARPTQKVVAIVGDGNFNMELNNLVMAMTYGIELKVIVINNKSLGMVASWENLFYNEKHTSTGIVNPDFGRIAQAYGMRAFTCTRRNLAEEMRAFMEASGSAILDARVFNDALCLPMVPPGRPLDHILM